MEKMDYKDLLFVTENISKKDDSYLFYFHGNFQKKQICYKYYYNSIKDCIDKKNDILKNHTEYRDIYINCSYIKNIWLEKNNYYYLTKMILVYTIKKDEQKEKYNYYIGYYINKNNCLLLSLEEGIYFSMFHIAYADIYINEKINKLEYSHNELLNKLKNDENIKKFLKNIKNISTTKYNLNNIINDKNIILDNINQESIEYLKIVSEYLYSNNIREKLYDIDKVKFTDITIIIK